MASDDALADLFELSAQVRDVAVLGESGFVVASSAAHERGEELARVATGLLALADEAPGRGDAAVSRVEVLDRDGGVFVVRDSGRVIVATTVADATPGLVVYDLRSTLGRYAAADAMQPTARGRDDA